MTAGAARTAAVACVLAAVLACAARPDAGGRDSPWLRIPAGVAEAHGWEGLWVETASFDLLAYRNGAGAEGGPLTVYIEGDGFAWASTAELSDDPSPRSARVLEMAVQDPSGAVAWLSRPCFYLPPDALAGCPSDTWSVARYGEEVVASLDSALDVLKAGAGAGGLRLVGVSGGGTLAALVAARRDDVGALVTVAANLDHAAWTRRHGVSPLAGSLNAADVADAIDRIPQVHFVGADDATVTRADVDPYVARMDAPDLTHVVVAPGRDHACCWTADWPALLEEARVLLEP